MMHMSSLILKVLAQLHSKIAPRIEVLDSCRRTLPPIRTDANQTGSEQED
jgi:hypothetical protein